MKKLLLLCLTSLSLTISAQSLVLTQAFNEPAIFDDEIRRNLDTSMFTTGLPKNTGANITWDFSNLKPSSYVAITSYDPPATYTSAANYPGCTMVQADGPLYTFLKSTTSPTTQTEILGLVSSTLSLTFTNSAIAVIYPLAYGNTINDQISGTASAFGQNGTCSGNIVTSADGTGTLLLPGGQTLSNVLRVKSVQSLSFNQGIIPIGSVRQTSYSFYHASNKFAILSLNYATLRLITSSTPTVTAFASGIAQTFPVGVNENSLDNAALSAYPTPFTDELNLSIDPQLLAKDIRLYSQLGQLVYQKEYAGAIDLSHLQSGIYFLEVSTARGLLRKKLVKQ